LNKIIEEFGKKIYQNNPSIRPIISYFYKILFLKPTFTGWGMKTSCEIPWNGKDGEIFLQANKHIEENFDFTKNPSNMTNQNVNEFLWRHWIVSYSIKHAIEFSDTNDYNFVECGVADGVTAFFALREIINNDKSKSRYSMHLYDSWDAMKKNSLLDSEMSSVGAYKNLNMNTTKQNLSEFEDKIIFHKGYIPESFTKLPESPKSIIYLSIDLNATNATISTLEFFFNKLVRGGVILFDDYGSTGHSDTKKITDSFFADKPGMLMQIPTGQAIYFR